MLHVEKATLSTLRKNEWKEKQLYNSGTNEKKKEKKYIKNGNKEQEKIYLILTFIC